MSTKMQMMNHVLRVFCVIESYYDSLGQQSTPTEEIEFIPRTDTVTIDENIGRTIRGTFYSRNAFHDRL